MRDTNIQNVSTNPLRHQPDSKHQLTYYMHRHVRNSIYCASTNLLILGTDLNGYQYYLHKIQHAVVKNQLD